jgi:hypothetical protein
MALKDQITLELTRDKEIQIYHMTKLLMSYKCVPKFFARTKKQSIVPNQSSQKY